jgi:hypothetical protein
MGKAALDNPDLPTEFVKDLLITRAEGRSLAKPFTPEGLGNLQLGSPGQAISRNDSGKSK